MICIGDGGRGMGALNGYIRLRIKVKGREVRTC
jgi:hypothetical protein